MGDIILFGGKERIFICLIFKNIYVMSDYSLGYYGKKIYNLCLEIDI